jgi:enoyl-CoA hydratase/carnithine racemase
VQDVVAPGEQYMVAKEIAASIAAAAPLGVKAILKSSRLAQYSGTQVAADHIFDDMAEVLQSEDAKEGIQSFNERRDAVFKGK